MPAKKARGGRGRALIDKLLIVSSGAGGVTPEVEQKLAEAFPEFVRIEFNPRGDFRKRITPEATVVVAGGDGTIGFVARALAGSRRRLGVLSLGTYNNFALSLGLPDDIDKAIEAVRKGRPRFVTLGKVGDTFFLEVAAIGMFGQAIELGEKAKGGELKTATRDLGRLVGARPFEYTISGDLDGGGRTPSLVFNNTSSTGARMAVGTTSPRDPKLELAVRTGGSRSDIVKRLLAGAVLAKTVDEEDMHFRFRRVQVTTRPRVAVYCDNARIGRTPVEITADPRALRVILPG